jgi:hypothetical protein
MNKLTDNQQQLIDQITEEFISHNQSKQASRGESLLGVDDIINSVQRKRDEIARIKAHNEAVHKSMRPIFKDNYEALSHEMDALGLDLRITSDWWQAHDGRRGITMKASVHTDRPSDFDFYFDAKITAHHKKFDGQPIWEVGELNPVLVYTFSSNDYTFEELCKNPEFLARIKRMYETKTK